MIIDCHGHYTTAPERFKAYHATLVDARDPAAVPAPAVSDDEIRDGIESAQLRLQRERGTDRTLFSPTAARMAHHLGTLATSEVWSAASNDLIHRVCGLYPDNFTGVCQLPQSPGAPTDSAARELRRCVEQLGFAGCNLNPDPSGGYWTDPPLTDRHWYPLYEAMVELDVPAMIHVSASCNPNFHTTGGHYLAADTTVFMQLLTSKLFQDFPTLRLVIPHGGGAVPFHWGRYRGLALDKGLGELEEILLRNVFFDTCVYHEPGVRLLAEVVPGDNLLFASEMVGAVRGTDPRTGHHFDDTRRYVDALGLDDEALSKIYAGNARRVYPALA
ncbi:MAG TPA: amidohydrolase family protein [Streptosporangiaceae bacterium]|jgi:4-oxalmesaconate hydratase